MPNIIRRLRDSKTMPVTSVGGLSSNDLCISCIILNSCELQESNEILNH